MRQFTYPKAVTHPRTNRARCRATALIETNALPLHQTARNTWNEVVDKDMDDLYIKLGDVKDRSRRSRMMRGNWSDRSSDRDAECRIQMYVCAAGSAQFVGFVIRS